MPRYKTNRVLKQRRDDSDETRRLGQRTTSLFGTTQKENGRGSKKWKSDKGEKTEQADQLHREERNFQDGHDGQTDGIDGQIDRGLAYATTTACFL